MTHDYLSALLTVWTLYAFATLVPGPNAICVASSALLGGRARGLSAAAGVASATLLWAALGVSGVMVALRARPEATEALQIAGAAVLVWLGWATLRAAPGGARRGSRGGGYLQGLLTGCSNPISAAIWTASAGYVLATGPTAGEVALYVTSCAALALGMHGTIALAVARLSRCRVRVAEDALRALCGGIFIFLGGMMVAM